MPLGDAGRFPIPPRQNEITGYGSAGVWGFIGISGRFFKNPESLFVDYGWAKSVELCVSKAEMRHPNRRNAILSTNFNAYFIP